MHPARGISAQCLHVPFVAQRFFARSKANAGSDAWTDPRNNLRVACSLLWHAEYPGLGFCLVDKDTSSSYGQIIDNPGARSRVPWPGGAPEACCFTRGKHSCCILLAPKSCSYGARRPRSAPKPHQTPAVISQSMDYLILVQLATIISAPSQKSPLVFCVSLPVLLAPTNETESHPSPFYGDQ